MDDRHHLDLLDAARMKTVELFRDFDFPLHPRRSVRFRAGITYSRVLEIAAREIERKGAGRIVDTDKPRDAASDIDARHAFTRHK
jgi:hypothetical protein